MERIVNNEHRRRIYAYKKNFVARGEILPTLGLESQISKMFDVEEANDGIILRQEITIYVSIRLTTRIP